MGIPNSISSLRKYTDGVKLRMKIRFRTTREYANNPARQAKIVCSGCSVFCFLYLFTSQIIIVSRNIKNMVIYGIHRKVDVSYYATLS